MWLNIHLIDNSERASNEPIGENNLEEFRAESSCSAEYI